MPVAANDSLQGDALTASEAAVYKDFFQDVWERDLGGKQKLLHKLKGAQVWKPNDNRTAKSILMVLEHQLAVGHGGPGSGGHSLRWTGTFSVEHIMPQVLVGACNG